MNRILKLIGSCTFLLSFLSIAAQPESKAIKHDDLGNGTFINPIFGGDYADPSIVRDGNDYYMTFSAFDYQPGLTVFHSTDLVNWEPISYALTTYLGAGWAPDICKYEDQFLIYFTIAGRGNFVVIQNLLLVPGVLRLMLA